LFIRVVIKVVDLPVWNLQLNAARNAFHVKFLRFMPIARVIRCGVIAEQPPAS